MVQATVRPPLANCLRMATHCVVDVLSKPLYNTNRLKCHITNHLKQPEAAFYYFLNTHDHRYHKQHKEITKELLAHGHIQAQLSIQWSYYY